jgi:hypothetical protein
MKWPTSRSTQAAIAFMGAVAISVAVYKWIDETHFARYASEHSHDGQDGLGAFMDALSTASFTMIGAFVVLFVWQRLATSR